MKQQQQQQEKQMSAIPLCWNELQDYRNEYGKIYPRLGIHGTQWESSILYVLSKDNQYMFEMMMNHVNHDGMSYMIDRFVCQSIEQIQRYKEYLGLKGITFNDTTQVLFADRKIGKAVREEGKSRTRWTPDVWMDIYGRVAVQFKSINLSPLMKDILDKYVAKHPNALQHAIPAAESRIPATQLALMNKYNGPFNNITNLIIKAPVKSSNDFMRVKWIQRVAGYIAVYPETLYTFLGISMCKHDRSIFEHCSSNCLKIGRVVSMSGVQPPALYTDNEIHSAIEYNNNIGRESVILAQLQKKRDDIVCILFTNIKIGVFSVAFDTFLMWPNIGKTW